MKISLMVATLLAIALAPAQAANKTHKENTYTAQKGAAPKKPAAKAHAKQQQGKKPAAASAPKAATPAKKPAAKPTAPKKPSKKEQGERAKEQRRAQETAEAPQPPPPKLTKEQQEEARRQAKLERDTQRLQEMRAEAQRRIDAGERTQPSPPDANHQARMKRIEEQADYRLHK
jgi:hypothetical protein